MDSVSDRTFTLTARSLDSELLSSDCSVTLLHSNWFVRLLWIVSSGRSQQG